VSDPESDAPPRAVFIAAVVIAVVAAIAVVIVAATRDPGRTPVPVATVPAPQSGAPSCSSLLAGLPDALGDYRRVELTAPAPAGVAAWRNDNGGEPVILRCGLDRPADFVVGSPLQIVDDVEWFRVADPAGTLVTWYTVDRPVYVALTLPADSGPTPIQDISVAVAHTMPARPIDPAPPR